MSVRREDIAFDEKDEALREDVSMLGSLVGELLREQGGELLFNRVENARTAAIRRREGRPESEDELYDLCCSHSPRDALDLVRSFSAWFQVANMAEKVHRIRRRREYAMDQISVQPLGIHDILNRLKDDGLDSDALQRLFDSLRIEPVFTAHPTEPTRRTILRKQHRIARRLVNLLDQTVPPQERRAAISSIRQDITSSWQTEEHASERMTVSDELEHVLFFMTDVIYRMIPPFYELIEDAAEELVDGSLQIPTLVRFASWVGGDMDGNPNVSAKTVRRTMSRQRALILNLYHREVLVLAERLSQSASLVNVSQDIKERIDEYSQLFPGALNETPARHRAMPYRVYLRLVAQRLQATFDDSLYPYERAEDFVADIARIAESFRVNGGQNAGLFSVRRLLRRAQTFGFHFLTLDIRQDSLVHRKVVAQGLDDDKWLERTPEDRAQRIRQALLSRESPVGQFDSLGRRTLSVFQTIAQCRKKYGRRAIGPFIISMTQDADDVLSVLLLAGWSGLAKRTGAVALDIAPLFETVEDLKEGPGIMRKLLDDELYREHLNKRGDRQVIMVGYSDSNKDGGLAAARWALQRAEFNLAKAMQEADIDLTIFHGRGGTISRGGSKTHSAVLASPRGTVNGRLRVTEQGEIINAKYGLRGIALRTLEQAVGSVALATGIKRDAHENREHWLRIMEEIAHKSRTKYRGLVYADPEFVSYFRQATPIDAIERMQIGSRPASRRQQRGIEDLRAIPWVFAWTQSRHIIPGWYGFGTGLETAIAEHGEEVVREMTREWEFFKTLFYDVEMVLAKCDMDIAEHYNRLADEELRRYFDDIRREFDLTVDLVLRLKGIDALLDEDKTLQRAIRLRNPYVDPMSLLQVDLLQRWRASNREDDQIFTALLASINGIAHGLQNTG